MRVLNVSHAGFVLLKVPSGVMEEKRLLFSDIPANRIYGLAADGRHQGFPGAER